MLEGSDILHFLEVAQRDPRIGPSHISLYLAIVYCWCQQGASGPVRFTARELMPIAKIAGATPFYRCLKELNLYGYVAYEPSFNPVEKSRVSIILDKVKAGTT